MMGRLLQWLLAFIAGGVAVFVLLTLANGKLPVPLPTPTSTPSATPSVITDDAWASVPNPALPVSVVAPGSTVTLAQPAQVEIALGSGKLALINVVVDAPTLAPDDDQAILRKAVPQLDGMEAFYFQVHVTKVAGDALAGADLGNVFDAVTDQRHIIQKLTLVDWRKCDRTALPAEIDTENVTATLCFAAAAPASGLTPAGVQFSQSGGPYDAAAGTAIVWLP